MASTIFIRVKALKTWKGVLTVAVMASTIIPTRGQLEQAKTSVVSRNSTQIESPPSETKFTFTVDDLSHQYTSPFRFGGQVISEESARWNQYRRAIEKYPNAVPCLSSGIDSNGTVDLRDMDWFQLKKVQDLDVCVFRILDTLSSVELMEDWIASQGFFVSPNKRYVGDSSYVPDNTINSTHYIEGSIQFGRDTSEAAGALSEKSNGMSTLAFSLNVYLDSDGNIAGVRITPRTQ